MLIQLPEHVICVNIVSIAAVGTHKNV